MLPNIFYLRKRATNWKLLTLSPGGPSGPAEPGSPLGPLLPSSPWGPGCP